MTPPRKKLVLVGGGHAQVFVLKAFGEKPPPNTDITLITKDIAAPYSGMLPGFVAGHYSFDACHIDLKELAKFANAKLVHGAVSKIDREAKLVHVEGHDAVSYDVLSINVGITPDTSDINGAQEHALVVKPVSTFAPKWQSFEARIEAGLTNMSLVVVGGGAAGFELALAAQHRLATLIKQNHALDTGLSITLAAGGKLLASHNDRARKLAYKTLQESGIELIEDDLVASISENNVRLQSGRYLKADLCLVATRAKAAQWLAESKLPVNEQGFLQTKATLQLIDDDTVFAVGDCATNVDHPRPKAGVFAVRQGPPLTQNLRHVLAGQTALPFTPQNEFLTLLSLGKKSAIAARGPYAAKGAWAWAWKDWIDQAFMKRFNNLPKVNAQS